MNKYIEIKGAKEHNLKNIDLSLPKGELIAVTGVSGSGKSSLAFDTLYREGQRRYLENLNAKARQFMDKLDRPEVAALNNLPPTLALNQMAGTASVRSTVGTQSGIYDYLRLLFSRLGQPSGLEMRHFSFNGEGACPSCKGLGVEDEVAEDLLVADGAKTLREGALVPTTPNGYIVYSQVTVDVMNDICNAHGFSVDVPFDDLTREQRDVIFFGSDRLKVPFGKHSLESRMKWSGITAKPREEGYYKGLIPVIRETLKRDRNPNILRFVRSVPCHACKGTRLSEKALTVRIDEYNIHDLADMDFAALKRVVQALAFKGREAVYDAIREPLLKRLDGLLELGLSYLSCMRPSASLSGGEARRLRLATQVHVPLRGLLYVLDEPGTGLHARDRDRLTKILCGLRDKGNTVISVEHDLDALARADHLIDLGPGAGRHGGDLLFAGTPQALLSGEGTPTASWLKTEAEMTRHHRDGDGRELVIGNATHHNLNIARVAFKLNCLNGVCGPSGAGKSSLVHDILGAALQKALHGSRRDVGAHGSIEGLEHFDKVIAVDQSPIGRTPRSNPATYTNLLDPIRALFAKTEAAKVAGLGKSAFSMNVKGGRCETCQGAGVLMLGMHGLPDVAVTCEDCNGKRFRDEVLAIEVEGLSIAEVLELTVEEAALIFASDKKASRILKTLVDVGLGYLHLGQSSTTLSGGEAQRVKLASELARPGTGRTLYVLDEPTAGLHCQDVAVLLKALDALVAKGNTVIVIEHHLRFLNALDYLVELGPESGADGGRVVACGSPDAVAAADTHTGRALRRLAEPLVIEPMEPSEEVLGGDPPIVLRGVTTHNLKGVDLEIPRNKLTVITGLSGSGKTSLAFDTLHAESSRSFAEGLSNQVRRFMGKTGRGDLEGVENLTASIAVRQGWGADQQRSTVGTATGIQDGLRLLFARAGVLPEGLDDGDMPDLKEARSFSFNHHQGACLSCKGLGYKLVVDERALITDRSLSLTAGAMDGTKAGRFYGEVHGQYVATLKAVGAAKGLDFEAPYQDLSEEAQSLALYGAGDDVFEVTWQYKRGKREGEHHFEGPWLGMAGLIEEEYARKARDGRGTELLPLMKEVTCEDCDGARLMAGPRDVRVDGLRLADVNALTVTALHGWLKDLDSGVGREIAAHLDGVLTALGSIGLGHLTTARLTGTLSGGERQRMRLARQVRGGLSGVTYVLDEPTTGLHASDTVHLLALLRGLVDAGNTVVVVEHDTDVIAAADVLVEMGPGAGAEGGTVLASGSPASVLAHPQSPTGLALGATPCAPLAHAAPSLRSVLVRNPTLNNLSGRNARLAGDRLVGIAGLSGSGKTSLVFGCLAATAAVGRPIGCAAVEGLDAFDNVITLDQKPLSGGNGMPVTYLGIYDGIRDAFAKSEAAKAAGLKKGHFSVGHKLGRCPACEGRGSLKTNLDFIEAVEQPCEACGGTRFAEAVLAVRYQGHTIADVLAMAASEALPLFAAQRKLAAGLEALVRAQLGYVPLGQPTRTLSGGEAQRLKFAAGLLAGTSGTRNLYLLDEPTTGLHLADVRQLVATLQELVKAGHGVIAIEHHQEFLNACCERIEMGDLK